PWVVDNVACTRAEVLARMMAADVLVGPSAAAPADHTPLVGAADPHDAGEQIHNVRSEAMHCLHCTNSNSTRLGSRPDASAAASATSWRGPSPATRVEVFYATDRKALSSNSFAGDRGSGALSFGISPVLLPARTIGLGIPLSQEKFEQSLSSALTRTGAKDILVFVHGYNFGFDEAVLWAGQLKHQLHFEGAVVLYSWPSSGNRWSYLGDSSNADWTTPHLAGFLQALAARTGRAQIHLLAHSLGSRPVVAALHSLAVGPHAARFGQIIFAAPDV